MDDFQGAIDFCRKNIIFSHLSVAGLFNLRGTVYYNYKNFNHAIADFKKAIEIDRTYMEAYYNAGSAYYEMAEFPMATEFFNLAIIYSFKNVNMKAYVLYKRGLSFARREIFSLAVKDFRSAIKLKPGLRIKYAEDTIKFKEFGINLPKIDNRDNGGERELVDELVRCILDNIKSRINEPGRELKIERELKPNFKEIIDSNRNDGLFLKQMAKGLGKLLEDKSVSKDKIVYEFVDYLYSYLNSAIKDSDNGGANNHSAWWQDKFSGISLLLKRQKFFVKRSISLFLAAALFITTTLISACVASDLTSNRSLAIQCISRNDYRVASVFLEKAFAEDSNIFNRLNFSPKQKEEIILGYLKIASSIEKPLLFEPTPFLQALGVDNEKLYDLCEDFLKKDLNSEFFLPAHMAARVFAYFGNPIGRNVLLEVLEDDIDSQGNLAIKNLGLPTNPKDPWRVPIKMLAAFALANLKEGFVLPALISILSQPDIFGLEWKVSAAYYLGKLKDARAVDALINSASSKFDDLGVISIWSLGEIGDVETMNFLAGFLNSNRYNFVDAAIEALGKLGQAEVVPYLERIYRGGHSKELKIKAISTIAQIGSDNALPVLIEASNKKNNSKIRQAALLGLSQFDCEEARKVLIDALYESDKEINLAAIIALSERVSDDKELPGVFIELLDKKSAIELKVAIISVLNGVNNPEIRPALEKYADDDNWRLRQEALIGLEKFWYEKEINKLMHYLSDPDERVQATVCLLLSDKVNNNPNVFTALNNMLFSQSQIVKVNTAVSLSPHVDKYPSLKATIQSLLTSVDINTKSIIFNSLAQAKNDSGLEIVSSFMHSSDKYIRQAVAASFGYSDSLRAAMFLKQMANDPAWQVKSVVATSLGNKFEESTKPVLRNLMQDPNPLVRQNGVISYGKMPGEISKDLMPSLNDNIWQVKFAASNVFATRKIDSGLVNEKLIYLAQKGENIFLRSVANLALGQVEEPRALQIIQTNLSSKNLVLRQSSAEALSMNNSLSSANMLILGLNDRHFAVRSISAQGIGNKITQSPELANRVAPLLNDNHWQVRQNAVSTLGKSNTANFDNNFLQRIKDPSLVVKREALFNLANKINQNPNLVNPFTDILKSSKDNFSRQISALSLNAVQAGQVNLDKGLVRENMPKIKVAVLIPGVDDALGFDPSSSRETNPANSKIYKMQFVRYLELSGIKFLEHYWSGNLISKDITRPFMDLEDARLRLDSTILSALRLAGPDGVVLVIMHSAGNFIGERFSSKDLNPYIKEAFRNGRIKLMSLATPQLILFPKFDRSVRNIALEGDLVYKGFGKLFILQNKNEIIFPFNEPYWNRVHGGNRIEGMHSVWESPDFINYFQNNFVMEIPMNSFRQIVEQQDMFKWNYKPISGYWPGYYNFSTKAPDDYWRSHQINSTLKQNTIKQPELKTNPSFDNKVYQLPRMDYNRK